jgi:hypothetical protein
MPRYTREQYRRAFEEYVQKYSWNIAVESSGWGTLEQYAARHGNIGKTKTTNPPRNQHLKSSSKETIGTISPYRQKLIVDRSALLQKLEIERMGDVRRKLWHELIKIEETTGHRLSKAVYKLYASWLRSARLKQEATLEVDEEDHSIIEWGGIRINLPQLKNWVIHRIGKLPRDHRVALIRCCEQYLTLNDLQAAELCRQPFRDSHSGRSFMKLFRKTLTQGVMGWKPLIMALRAAADRWTAEEIRRLLKEFFDPNGYAFLWLRMSKFADTQGQLEARLQAQEAGIHLPKGNQKKYVKWLKLTNDAFEHAKMMILLQRTQELDINPWREIREQAYERFGRTEYKKLLQERGDTIPDPPKGSIPQFGRKKILFGAMKEEQDGLTPEWERRLPEIYEILRSERDWTDLLEKLIRPPEELQKMKCIRKGVKLADDEWLQAVDQMRQNRNAAGFNRGNLDNEIEYRCIWEAERICPTEASKADPIREGMRTLPELMARWDWYQKRQGELRPQIVELWKKIMPMRAELILARNFNPDLPELLRPKLHDQMIVEIWKWNDKTNKPEVSSEVIWDNDLNPTEFRNWFKKRWCDKAKEIREGNIMYISPLWWVVSEEQRATKYTDIDALFPLEWVMEWPMVWV